MTDTCGWLGVDVQLRLSEPLGSENGYGTWTEAVEAAAAASASGAGPIAICDDRGRLYLYTISAGCGFNAHPFRVGERRESGYAFAGTDVRGIVDGNVTISRGDCLTPWVPVPIISR